MIKYKFFGNVENADILEFYHDSFIDCFVHTSDREGLPVAIMEAESAGIPIVATCAGGISEMIEGNGFLLPVDCTATDIADALLFFVNADHDKKQYMHFQSRKIWEEKFNALNNSKAFVESVDKDFDKHENIVLITEGYPFRLNEVTFLGRELNELVRTHEHVTVIARINKDISEEDREKSEKAIRLCIEDDCLRKKVTVIPYIYRYSPVDAFLCLFKYLFCRRTRVERVVIMKSDKRRLIRFWESLKYYSGGEDFYKWIKKQKNNLGLEFGNTLVYTFWNLPPTLGICLHRKEIGNFTLITRVHGYDWQDERWEKSLRKPFAETVDELVDRIIFICKTGKEQYIERYKIDRRKEKYTYSYLGSSEYKKNSGIVAETVRNDFFKVASCGSLIALKRVDMIIDALAILQDKNPQIDIEWVHFGDGPLREKLEKYAAKCFCVGA